MRKLSKYEGVVENGHVRLPANADIPEKTRVYVLVPDVESPKTLNIASPRLVHPERQKISNCKLSKTQPMPAYDSNLFNPPAWQE